VNNAQLAAGLEQQSTLAWIYLNGFQTENRKPMEFSKHRFAIAYLDDDHPHKVTKKSSQVGWTVIETFDDLHKAGHKHMNVIHTLQTSDVIKGFVKPKVDMIIENNPKIKAMIKADSENLKQIGDNFIYFRGANSISQAINISADILKIDEEDRSDPIVVQTYHSRLDFSEYRWVRRFSNPSAVGAGVDAVYAKSNQFHWIMQCHHCNHRMYIDFEPSDDKNHFVDKQKAIYACGKCHRELSDADRINGEWVAKYPSRDEIHGYWTSQMMAPWFTAKNILSKYEDQSIEVFYNFVLGKAYTPSNMIIDREAILRACSPSLLTKTEVAMGVDNGVLKTYVIGTPDGIFAHGQTESWEEIEHLKQMYNATMVMDPNPYPTTPKMLVDKYKGSAYICYFKQDTKNLGIIQWGTGVNAPVVYADRTKLIDLVAQEITDLKLLFRERPSQLEDIIQHWNNLYRTTIEEDDGRSKSTWLKKEGKMSDYPFALAYFRIALTKVMGRGEISSYLEPPSDTPKSGIITDTGYQADMSQDLQEAFNGNNL
jgi:hypothetical protein